MVCLSSVNASPYTLYLQVKADLDSDSYHYEPARFDELADMFEVSLPEALGRDGGGGAALQQLG